jgi:hypothetical protein
MSVSGVGTTQNIQSSSSVAPLAEMNLEQLMMFVVFQRMDVNALQLRQHASEMDARTQKLEILGRFSQALGKIASQYGSEAKQELKNTDIGKKMSKTDWSAIQAENLTPEQKKAKLDSMSASIDQIDAQFAEDKPNQKFYETDFGKNKFPGDEFFRLFAKDKSKSQWNANGENFKKAVFNQTDNAFLYVHQTRSFFGGDLDKAKRAEKEEKEVGGNLLNIARTGYEMGLLSEDDVTRMGKGEFTKAEFQALKQKIEQYDVNQPSESKNVSSNGKNAEEKARAQDLKDSLEDVIKYGRETGLMSETDISRLTKGEFKKSEVEALQASIKTEQDKIGNENTKQQLTLQSITGRLESVTNLAGTLTKKIGDIWSAIIQKT